MTIITDKITDAIIAIGVFKSTWENGYPVLEIESGVETAFSPEVTTMYEIGEIPEGVETVKYCYTPEDGFYLNPNYREPENNPYGIPDEMYDAIRDEAVAQIEREVAGDADE